MARGKSYIPELRLETLTRFMQQYNSPVDSTLSNMFSTTQSPSSSIKWQSQRGGRGMTPFVPPGSPAPLTSPFGIASHSAEAAYWKEKMYFDEEFLNNMRQEGTEAGYLSSKARLSREMAGIKNRAVRRKEWMFAKMLFAGSFSYAAEGGVKNSVDYGLPDENSVTLATDYLWSTGSKADILGDMIGAKRVLKDGCGGKVELAVCTSAVLEYIARDPAILTLLQKSTFGNGDLFSGNKNSVVGVNPNILANLLDIPTLLVYDEMYEVRSWLTAVVTLNDTVAISVDDVTDWEVGGEMRFHNNLTGTYEDVTIESIEPEVGTVTVDTVTTASYRAGRDYVSMTRRFIPDDQFSMFCPTVEGMPVAEYMQAPFGLGRTWGLQTDTKENWDPDGIFIRVQDKGLPVLYNRDAIYTLTVA